MCGQEFTGRSKKKLEPKDAAEVTKFDTDNKNLKQLRANQPKGDSTTGNVVEDDDDELSNQPDYKDDRD